MSECDGPPTPEDGGGATSSISHTSLLYSRIEWFMAGTARKTRYLRPRRPGLFNPAPRMPPHMGGPIRKSKRHATRRRYSGMLPPILLVRRSVGFSCAFARLRALPNTIRRDCGQVRRR